MIGTRTAALLAAIGLVPVSVQAQDEPVDNIVVTGTRATDRLAEIPYTTTVITLADLEARNASSVPDVLRHLPGVHVVQPSGQGGVARVFLRGGDQNLTMILLDGVRVNDPNDSRGSAFDFSMINVQDIERIEIVRGPQSAVYGSDALAGVINIISKGHSDDLAAAVAAELGSDGYSQAALDVAGPIGDGGFSLRAMTKDDGEAVEQTAFEAQSVAARLALGSEPGWNLRLFGSYTDSEGTAFPEDSGGAELAVIRDVDRRSSDTTRLGMNGSFPVGERWSLKVLATWYDQDAWFFSPGVAPGVRDGVPPNGADSTLERSDLAVNAVVDVSDSLTVTFGADRYDEDGRSEGFVEFFPGVEIPSDFEFERRVTGVFGEVHYVPTDGLTLMGSVRRDDSNAEAAETTSRVGALYAFNEGATSLRANWGQGFSLPGFFALASPLVGNPELRPETSESYDIGISHRFAKSGLHASLEYFHNEFLDLIDFEDSVFQMVNRDALDVDGVELQFEVPLGDALSLHLQATWLDMDLANSDEPLRQRPDWRGGVTMRWSPAGPWLVDAAWLYTGETFDSSIPTGDGYLDAYNRLDLTAAYRFSERLEAVLSVDNALDQDYYEAIGFPSVGTRARLGIRLGF